MHKNCPTKLQVSNLSKDTSHREIESWLVASRVSGANISKKKDSYILEFESAAQAQRAKEILSKNTYINGNICKVAHYREFMAVGEATVVVQGLTPDSNFVGIEQVIRQFPGVTEVSFKKKSTKPYAFVSFEKMEQANLLIKELHGSWVHGDFLRIFIVSDNTNGSSVTSPNASGFGGSTHPSVTIPSSNYSLTSPDPAAGNESPTTRRLRSSSLNTHMSFDAFLDNISNNFNLLNFVNTTAPAPGKRNLPNPIGPNTSNTYVNSPSPIQSITSPNSQNQNSQNNRKNRSKSLGTKVYVPITNLESADPMVIEDDVGKSKQAVRQNTIINGGQASLLNGLTSPPLIPDPIPHYQMGMQMSASAESPAGSVKPAGHKFTKGHVRKRSVSFDDHLHTIIDNPLSDYTTTNNSENPVIPAPSPSIPPTNPADTPDAPDSPTSRMRSKSFGNVAQEYKSKTANISKPGNGDLFVRQRKSSKSPNPTNGSDEYGDDFEDNFSNESKDVSPSSSVSNLSSLSSTNFSLSNLPHRNNYYTLRLEGLDEEITSTILYDLFNCVLDEPPSLLSAKALHGQGFVDFDNQDMATTAKNKLHGRKFMGNPLQISLLMPEDKCVLKVTNLPFSTDEKDLEEHFSDIAGLISANIVRKATGISKGFAFLVFCHFSAAEKALQEKHGTIVQGRPINIRFHNGGNNNNPNNPNNPNRKTTLNKSNSKPSLKQGIEGSEPNTPNIPPDTLISPRVASEAIASSIISPPPGFAASIQGVAAAAVIRKSEPEGSGERPDDASYQLTDEEAELHLARFNQELNLAVSKILTNQANHAHRTDRLRQNAQLLEAIRTKLAEKKLEQLNDELMYAKQKHILQQHTAALSVPAPSFAHLPNGELTLGMDEVGADNDTYLQLKQMRAFKQASLRKIIEELGDQMKLAKLMKEIEEDRQSLEDQQIQLETIEVISSIAGKIKKVPVSKLQEKIQLLDAKVQEKRKNKEDFQKLQELKRSYDINLDPPTPPRTMSLSTWPNDEAVKIDTFQLYFTEGHFSLRCCNIQLTRASIRPRPFGRGTEHLSYWVKLASDPTSVKVAKVPIMSRGPEAEKEVCMQDISCQLYATSAAKLFNEKKLPRAVEYIPIQLLCFYQRTPQVYMTIEPSIEGVWKMYNNNSGLIDVEKNAFVHAFSHFSYDYSQGRMMVTNLQGSRDQSSKYVLTDPSVHCLINDNSFGKSNLGQAGIDEFFRSHVCNKVCHSLHLSQHYLQPHEDMPATMS